MLPRNCPAVPNNHHWWGSPAKYLQATSDEMVRRLMLPARDPPLLAGCAARLEHTVAGAAPNRFGRSPDVRSLVEPKSTDDAALRNLLSASGPRGEIRRPAVRQLVG